MGEVYITIVALNTSVSLLLRIRGLINALNRKESLQKSTKQVSQDTQVFEGGYLYFGMFEEQFKKITEWIICGC